MDTRDLVERLSQLSVEIGRGRPVTDLRLLTAPIDAVAEIERLELSADLIAAAPDLLAACEAYVLSVFETGNRVGGSPYDPDGDICNMMRDAIAKAKGGASLTNTAAEMADAEPRTPPPTEGSK